MILKKMSAACGLALLSLLLFNFTPAVNKYEPDFEGIIHYKIPQLKDEIGTSKLVYMIKKDMIRIEYQSKGSQTTSLLYRQKNQTMFLNISSLGGYVEVPPGDVKKNIRHHNVQFISTGQTKTMAGYPCSVSKAKLGDVTYEYCFASGIGTFILPVNSMTSGKVPAWASLKFPEGKLPLEVIRLKNGTKDETVLSATEIEKKKLDRNLFSVFNQ